MIKAVLRGSVAFFDGVLVGGVPLGMIAGRGGGCPFWWRGRSALGSGGLLPWLPSGGVHGLIGYYLPYDWAMSGRKSWNNYGIITG